MGFLIGKRSKINLHALSSLFTSGVKPLGTLPRGTKMYQDVKKTWKEEQRSGNIKVIVYALHKILL